MKFLYRIDVIQGVDKDSLPSTILFVAIILFGLYSCFYSDETFYESVPTVITGTWQSADFIGGRDVLVISPTHISGDKIKEVYGPKDDIYGDYSLYVGSGFFYSCRLHKSGVLEVSFVQEGEDRYGSPRNEYIDMGDFTKR